MDKDHRDIVRRLFVLATEILEDSHETVSEGQSVSLGANQYAARAEVLIQAATELSEVGGAIKAALLTKRQRRNRGAK